MMVGALVLSGWTAGITEASTRNPSSQITTTLEMRNLRTTVLLPAKSRVLADEREDLTPETVPASEFTRNFGRYRMRAQREPVAVSSHGRITGYFVSPGEYAEFKLYRESRRSFATAELSEESQAIRSSRIDPRHADLDRMLDPE